MKSALPFLLCLIGTQALAQEARQLIDPNTGQPIVLEETIVDRIDACIGTVGEPGEHPEFCMGLYAQPCMEEPKNQTTEGLVACLNDEGAAWTEVLEREYTYLLNILNEDQRLVLRSSQRKWASFRDAECAFPNVLVSSALAQPWAADCMMQNTARRAMEIRGYRDYLEY